MYVVFAGIDLYVAYRLVPPAMIRPHVAVLSGAAIGAITVAVGGVIGALLGINGIVIAATGEHLLPPELGLLLLVVALGAPSIGMLYFLVLIRLWDRTRAQGHVHHRGGEEAPHLHRRSTDPQDGPVV